MGEDWADSTIGRRLTLRQDLGRRWASHGLTVRPEKQRRYGKRRSRLPLAACIGGGIFRECTLVVVGQRCK